MTIERARALRDSATEAERRLWRALREMRAQGWHWRRQVPLGRYIVDFACHRARLLVEADGSQHGEAPGLEKDRIQDAWLSSRGFRVLRFWNNDILARAPDVLETIHNALAALHPPLDGEGRTLASAKVRGGVNVTRTAARESSGIDARLDAAVSHPAPSPSPSRGGGPVEVGEGFEACSTSVRP